MPSRLVKWNKDPQGIGRGPGVYYHRGKGKYSKYNPERDAMIEAKGFKVNKIGIPSKSKGRHLSDGKLNEAWGLFGKKTRRK